MTSTPQDTEDDEDKFRLDKWLWAARFFKTRSLAVEAINGGKVRVNDNRAKPARVVRIGDNLSIRRGPRECVVVVRGLSRQRGPASQAELLYEETAASRQKREELAAQHKLQPPLPAKRPSKRERRHIIRFTRQDE